MDESLQRGARVKSRASSVFREEKTIEPIQALAWFRSHTTSPGTLRRCKCDRAFRSQRPGVRRLPARIACKRTAPANVRFPRHSSRSGPSTERLLRSCGDHRLNGHVGRIPAASVLWLASVGSGKFKLTHYTLAFYLSLKWNLCYR
jgi:hypothetical protein